MDIYQKLEDIALRYGEVRDELASPGAASDPSRFKKLMKEESELSVIASKFEEYKKVRKDIEDTEALLESETDPEMRELAKEELQSSREQAEALDGELRILLLPKDPDDGKNVIVENRAGAGGDEAALFEGDLFRMYKKYA